MAYDKKHLRLRGNVWWLHYRIPERHKLLPECLNFNSILTKSLGTDSIREAKRRRDIFLHGLEAQAEDYYKAWLPKRQEPVGDGLPEAIVSLNPPYISFKPENPNMVNVRAILAKSGYKDGSGADLTKMKSAAQREREAVFALLGEKRHAGKSLKNLTKAVIRETEAKGLASSSNSKIERSTQWFLESIMEDDIDIDLIEFDLVSGCLTAELEAGKSGSTVNGYLWGLKKVWERARRSKLVSGDNPFTHHRISAKAESHYDPFTLEEIRALYDHADTEFKTLIHAGATTGARIGEMLRTEVKVINGQHCWLFNFKHKGKTEQSTRIVPLHDSLQLPEGFSFKISYRRAQRIIGEYIDTALGERLHELTGKPRTLRFHSFRSTVITHLRRLRYSEKAIGSVTGHLGEDGSKGSSLPVYEHVESIPFKKELVDQIQWIDQLG